MLITVRWLYHYDDNHWHSWKESFRNLIFGHDDLLKHSYQLLGGFGNVKGTLNHLLGHESLMKGFLLRTSNQNATFCLEVVSGSHQICQGQAQRTSAPRCFFIAVLPFREERNHVSDSPNYSFRAGNESVEFLIFGGHQLEKNVHNLLSFVNGLFKFCKNNYHWDKFMIKSMFLEKSTFSKEIFQFTHKISSKKI